MTVEEKLAVDKFHVDEEFAHIDVDKEGDAAIIARLVKLCPAGLYVINEDGELTFDYAGCLECGTCRIACGDTIVAKWTNPRGGMGVAYRQG